MALLLSLKILSNVQIKWGTERNFWKLLTFGGCYLGTYVFFFMIPYGQGHSFFISLFRYICIIHPERLSKRKISPEVRKNMFKHKQLYFLFDLTSISIPLFHFRKLDTLLSFWNFYFPVLPQYQYGYQHVLKTPVLFWIVLEKMMSFTLIMIISLKVVAIPVVKFQVWDTKLKRLKVMSLQRTHNIWAMFTK